jgi:hypothetical protein
MPLKCFLYPAVVGYSSRLVGTRVDQGRRPPFLLEERHVDAGVRILKAAAQKAAKQQKKVAASA